MQSGTAAHRPRRGPILATLAVVAVIVAAVLWVEAPVIWPKAGPPVVLLGINRTLTYNGSNTGYLSGTVSSGCPVCPFTIDAGTTASVNATWLSSDPIAFHLNYTFVNVTVRSPYPFLAVEWSGSARPSVYSYSGMWTAGGPGGSWGIPLSMDVPFDSAGLPSSGYIQEWINVSASTAPWPTPA